MKDAKIVFNLEYPFITWQWGRYLRLEIRTHETMLYNAMWLCDFVKSFLILWKLYIYTHTHTHTHTHIDIKGGLRTFPFSSSRESALFSGEFFFFFFLWIYVYVCVCVFLFAHSFPCQTNKKNQNIRSGREMRLCRVPMPFSPPRFHATQQCSAHWSAHAHHRQAESCRSEDLPPFPVVYVLVWRWVVMNKRLSYMCLEFTAN